MPDISATTYAGLRGKVLGIIKAHPNGILCHQVEDKLRGKVSRHDVLAVIWKLRDAGLVTIDKKNTVRVK